VRVGIGASGEVQVVCPGPVSLRAQVEDVSHERRVITKIKIRIRISGVIELDRRVTAGFVTLTAWPTIEGDDALLPAESQS
jgi:hypothetical protein